MTKETMIWQTLSMIIAGMVRNKTVPKTKQEFEEKCVKGAQSILGYSKKDILHVLDMYDVTGFAEEIRKLYQK